MNVIETGPLKAVLFDMDNTFFDFIEAKLRACSSVLSFLKKGNKKELGNESELFEYFIRGLYGFEDYENIKDFMLDKAVFTEKHYEDCCAIYEKEKLDSIELYPGVKNTFDALQKLGLKLAVVTDADREHALARLEKVELIDYFDLIVSADISGRKKPDPGPFLFALRAFNVKPEETLIVGDSIRRDITPARALGLSTAYAAYGDRNTFEPQKECCWDFQLNAFPEVMDCIGSFGWKQQQPGSAIDVNSP